MGLRNARVWQLQPESLRYRFANPRIQTEPRARVKDHSRSFCTKFPGWRLIAAAYEFFDISTRSVPTDTRGRERERADKDRVTTFHRLGRFFSCGRRLAFRQRESGAPALAPHLRRGLAERGRRGRRRRRGRQRGGIASSSQAVTPRARARRRHVTRGYGRFRVRCVMSSVTIGGRGSPKLAASEEGARGS